MATTQTNLSPLIIALDPGFGNTKICIDGKTSVIQSVIVRPKEIGLAGIGYFFLGLADPALPSVLLVGPPARPA